MIYNQIFRNYFFSAKEIRVVFFLFLFFSIASHAQTVSWTTNAAYFTDTSNNQNPTSVTTYNGSTYYVFTNPARQMVVGKISPTGVVLLDTVFDLEMGLDEKYHICPTIGVDKNGYIHVCGDMHNDAWKYYRSNKPEDISGWTRRYDLPGLSVTYPTIFYDKNREMYILFRHRSDSLGDGNHRVGIAKYNVENSTFSMVGGVSYVEKNGLASKTKTMAWARGFGGNDCWYIKPGHRIYFDGNNRMHFIATVINICLGTFSDTDVYSPSLLKGGYESHTHILYAYSDDSGKTWKKAGGGAIASLPLTVSNASIALNRTAQHDIIGGECELGAFDTNTPIISYMLNSDQSKHNIKWNGNVWVEFTVPNPTNIFMCRPNGYAAWYNNTKIDYTNDGINWTTLSGTPTAFPRGASNVSSTGLDREYFKQTGDFRYQGVFNYWTNSRIYTLKTNIGNVGNIVPTGVSLNSSNVSLNIGTVYLLTATIVPANATNKNLIWTSSNNSVVYVNGNGLLIPYKCGTATVTVTTQDGSKAATGTVVVTSAANPLTGLNFSSSSLVLLVGGQKQINPIFTPNNVCNPNLVWSSGNANIATVDENGVVNAITSGNTIITASNLQSGLSASCNVTVSVLSNLIQNSEFNLGTAGWNFSQQLGGAGTFSVVSGAGLSGSNAAKITITNTGTNINSLRLTANSYTLVNGKKYELYFKAKSVVDRQIMVVRAAIVPPYTYYLQSTENITTQSTVYGPYTFRTGTSDLTSQILFAFGGDTASVFLDSITLNDITNTTVTKILLNKTALTLGIGSSYQLFDTIIPVLAVNQSVTITSNNPLVATVNPYGVVTGVGLGTATITYVSNQTGVTSTCIVTVTSPLPLNKVLLNGKIVGSAVSLTWETFGQQQVDYFILQRQNAGESWDSLGVIIANNGTNNNYKFWDGQPQKTNLYRLKINLKDGSVLYSNVVSIAIGADITAKISPNPFTEKAILDISDKAGLYEIRITNIAGKLIRSGKGNNAQLNNLLASVFRELQSGYYLLSLTSKDWGTTLKLIKQ